MPLAIRSDVPLAPFTTFELGGPARAFVEVASEDELHEALAWSDAHALPIAILGGGSNVVVRDDGFDGLVVRVALRGVVLQPTGDTVHVIAAAGEPWDPLVARTVAKGMAGIECLSGIPGQVGATPIQNVGAYGQEVAQTIVAVRTFDRRTRTIEVRSPEWCRFRYRQSIFKEDAGRDQVVTAVTYALRPDGVTDVRYPELERAIAARGGTVGGGTVGGGTVGGGTAGGGTVDVSAVREAVLSLRRSKSMVLDPDDPNRRSAGSFFTNPVVPDARADDVADQAVALGLIADRREMPRFPVETGTSKLSAAWLIERAGFARGARRGPVGISSRHALALVHHGGGTVRALLDFAREIRDAVAARFGVQLHPEPVILGGTSADPLLAHGPR